MGRLKRYMDIIERVAKEVDQHLVGDHIGEYETIFYYHRIKDSLPLKAKDKALRKELNGLNILSLRNKNYCKELIDYYDSI